MRKLRSPIAAVLLLTVIAFTNLSIQKALADGCDVTPEDRSQIISAATLSDCGDITWDLQVEFALQPYDEGYYDGFGTCTGGYELCNCSPVPSNFKAPTKSFTYEKIDEGGGDYSISWYWNIKNYEQPSYTACTSGNCLTKGYASESDPTYTDMDQGYDSVDYSCTY